jgi:hypothetical protein
VAGPGREKASPGRPLDHLVVVVEDLDSAAARMTERGFTVTPLSHHPFGTSNRLIMFPGCYLEMVTVTRPELVPDEGFAAFVAGCLTRGDLGPRMVVLKTEEPDADRARLLAADIPTPEPVRFGREAMLPDGSTSYVEFVTVLPEAVSPGFSVFYCRHLTPGRVWHPSLLDHPNGASRLVSARIGDPGEAGWQRLARIADLESAPPADLGTVRVYGGPPTLFLEAGPEGNLQIDLDAIISGSDR